MALCTLLYHTHGVARENLARRLRQLSFDGNRAYDMAPLDLGQPIKGIVESPYYLNDPEVAAKNAWVNANKGANDTNGSNAPLLRIHPFAASMCTISTTHTLHNCCGTPRRSNAMSITWLYRLTRGVEQLQRDATFISH